MLEFREKMKQKIENDKKDVMVIDENEDDENGEY